MTVKTIFWENRLTKLIRKPGGMTVDKAVARADENLLSLRDQCLAALDAKLGSLRALAAPPTAGGHEAALQSIYVLASDIVGLAKPAGFPHLGSAAYSLCELIDHMAGREAEEWSSVLVHVETIGLLRGPLAEKEEDAAALLEGLEKLLARLRA